jgi:hypothetical protein
LSIWLPISRPIFCGFSDQSEIKVGRRLILQNKLPTLIKQSAANASTDEKLKAADIERRRKAAPKNAGDPPKPFTPKAGPELTKARSQH